ncbi:hypothetical protein F5Y04DRAFT_128948 [Hypomontagnella monticulosa]|nr:hypothetical protein F5Y04DRAFT_128948 [Hypomontagnella monticulosa]
MSIIKIFRDLESCSGDVIDDTGSIRDMVDLVFIPDISHNLYSTHAATNCWDPKYVWFLEILRRGFPSSRPITFSVDAPPSFASSLIDLYLHSCTTKLLDSLIEYRKDDPLRPLILISHNLGSIILKRALLQAADNNQYGSVRESVRAIVSLVTLRRPLKPLARPPKRFLPYQKSHVLSLKDNLWRSIGLSNPFSTDHQGRLRASVQCAELQLIESPPAFTYIDEKWVRTYEKQLRVLTFLEVVSPAVAKVAARDNECLGGLVVPLASSQWDLDNSSPETNIVYRVVKDRLSWMFQWVRDSEPIRMALTHHDLQWLRSLYPANLASRENRISDPAAGTFDWVWAHPSFNRWFQSSSGIYCIFGKAGSGKSTLAKFIANSVSERLSLRKCTGSRSPIIAPFYCDDSSPPISAEGILRSILHQVISSEPSLIKYIAPSMRRTYHWQDDISSFTSLLAETLLHLSKHARIFIILDALDECHDVLDGLIDVISGSWNHLSYVSRPYEASCVCDSSPPCLKLLITSRPTNRFNARLNPLGDYMDLSTGEAADGLMHDARAILDNRLNLFTDKGDKFDVLIPTLERLISADDSTGIFLWVILGVKFLSRDQEHGNIDETLSYLTTLPTNINDLYGSILKQSYGRDSYKSRLALIALRWVFLARRPLAIEELAQALRIGAGDLLDSSSTPKLPPGQSMTERNLCLPEIMIEILSPLLEVRASIVTFVHASVKEFLYALDIEDRFSAHDEIASTCLRYLTFVDFEYIRPRLQVACKRSELTPQDPFLLYAAVHWYHHIRLGESSITDIHKFTSPRSRILQIWFPIWWEHQCLQQWEVERYPKYPTEGIILSFLGNTPMVSELLQQQTMSVDECTPKGEEWTPLMAASWRGHDALVELLLSRSGGYTSNPRQNSRALMHAIDRGHKTTAQMLVMYWAIPSIGLEVSILNFQSDINDSPLLAAIRTRDDDMVRFLISYGADVNSPSDLAYPHHSTPMTTAVKAGASRVVEMLLASGASTDYPISIRTAAKLGAWDIAQTLHNVRRELGKLQHDFQAMIHYAAYQGDTRVIKLLLEYDIRISSTEEFGYTPLQAASRSGQLDAVRLLHGVDPTSAIDAFMDACEYAHLSIVQFFLAIGVDVNETRSGRSAVHCVLSDPKCGHVTTSLKTLPHEEKRLSVLKLLLNGGIYVNQKDTDGNTGLHLVALRAEKNLIQFFIDSGADVNLVNEDGDTALDITAQHGCPELVQLLVTAGAYVSNGT